MDYSVLLVVLPRKNLRPVKVFLSHPHVLEVGIHDVGAVARAGKPAGDHGIHVRIIPGDVLAYRAPGEAGPPYPRPNFRAVAALMLHPAHTGLVC